MEQAERTKGEEGAGAAPEVASTAGHVTLRDFKWSLEPSCRPQSLHAMSLTV